MVSYFRVAKLYHIRMAKLYCFDTRIPTVILLLLLLLILLCGDERLKGYVKRTQMP